MERRIVQYEILSCGEWCPFFKRLIHDRICTVSNFERVWGDPFEQIPEGYFPAWCPLTRPKDEGAPE